MFIRCNNKEVELIGRFMTIPVACPACGGPVAKKVNTDGSDGAALVCSNVDCKARVVAKVKRWLTSLGVLGIGDTLLECLYADLNIRSVADLYDFVASDCAVSRLSGLRVGNGVYGDSRAEMVLGELKKALEITVPDFIGSLGIEFMGKRRAKLIMDAVPGELDTIDDWLSGKLTSDAIRLKASIDGIADVIQDALNASNVMIKRLAVYMKFKMIEKPKVVDGRLSGRVFVFTGKIEKCDKSGNRYTRELMHKVVLDNGGAVGDEVRKGVTDLVTADVKSTSSKMTKAVKLGINVLAESDFWGLVE